MKLVSASLSYIIVLILDLEAELIKLVSSLSLLLAGSSLGELTGVPVVCEAILRLAQWFAQITKKFYYKFFILGIESHQKFSFCALKGINFLKNVT